MSTKNSFRTNNKLLWRISRVLWRGEMVRSFWDSIINIYSGLMGLRLSKVQTTEVASLARSHITLRSIFCRPFFININFTDKEFSTKCRMKSTSRRFSLVHWHYMSTNDKCTWSGSGHYDPSAFCTATMHYRDYCHVDGNSSVLSPSKTFPDVIWKPKNK